MKELSTVKNKDVALVRPIYTDYMQILYYDKDEEHLRVRYKNTRSNRITRDDKISKQKFHDIVKDREFRVVA